ncbi:MAG: HAMP domain-containing protein [Rhodobacterales bacterium]
MMHDSLRADVLFAILTGPEGAAEDREAAQAELARHVADFESSIAALQKLPLDPEIRTNVDAVVPLLAAYISKAEEASGAALADTAAGRALMPNFNAAFTDLEGAMEVLGERIEDFGNSAGIQAQAQNWVWLQIMAVMSILVAGGTFVSNHILSNSISRPLAVVTLDIEAVSRGDLDQPAQDIDRNDEVGSIAKAVSLLREKLVEAREAERERLEGTQQRVVSALGVGLRNLADGDLTRTIPNDFPQEYAGLRDDYNRAVETLRDTIARIVDASRTIRKETGEIRSASANLSQRTENQAATLEETAAALEELTANVASAARGAREVEGIVNETRLDAAKSGEIVRNAVEAINGIKQSSEEISTIIGLIEDFSDEPSGAKCRSRGRPGRRGRARLCDCCLRGAHAGAADIRSIK